MSLSDIVVEGSLSLAAVSMSCAAAASNTSSAGRNEPDVPLVYLHVSSKLYNNKENAHRLRGFQDGDKQEYRVNWCHD